MAVEGGVTFPDEEQMLRATRDRSSLVPVDGGLPRRGAEVCRTGAGR